MAFNAGEAGDREGSAVGKGRWNRWWMLKEVLVVGEG